MGSEIVMALVGVVCGGLSSLLTFIFTKRKYNAEVDSQQIQNMSDAFNTYKKMMEDTVSTQNKKIAELQKENDELRQQVSKLQMQLINFFGARFKESSTELQDL